MRISVFGLGYVGCVSAACLARDGHSVIGVEVNPQKAALLASGHSPVVEPGLDDLVSHAVKSGRLRVTMDGKAAVAESDFSVVCVGTPSNVNGSLKLHYVENVCTEIGLALAAKRTYHVVVIRSTVLPGTAEERLIPLLEEHSSLRVGTDLGLCVNPEFLREGTAIDDFARPGLIVIGESDRRSGDAVQELYATVDAPLVRTSLRTAEMVKYVSNAFHALKVAFANEIGNLCKAQGVDGQEVMRIMCQDRRLNISGAYLRPGFAFGGSCLPKDLRALTYRAKQVDIDCPLLSAVLPSNQKQVELALRLIESKGRKRIGILGLSFKAGTDDVRESPSVALVETLVGRGYQVRIFDDRVQLGRLVGANKSFLQQELPHIASLMCPSLEQLVAQSEVVVITNGAQAFATVGGMLRRDQVLVDFVGTAKDNGVAREVYEGICW